MQRRKTSQLNEDNDFHNMTQQRKAKPLSTLHITDNSTTNYLLIILILINSSLLALYVINNLFGRTISEILNPRPSILIVFDHIDNNKVVPGQFRTSDTLIQAALNKPNFNGSIFGLDRLRIAGGQQFSTSQFDAIRSELPLLGAVLDLRKESHGFLNGLPISWYGQANAANLYLSPDEVLRDERNRLRLLNVSAMVDVSHVLKESTLGEVSDIRTARVQVRNVFSEEYLVKDLHSIKYHRFFITDHHGPSAAEVDRFVYFVVKWNQTYYESNAQPYIYLHCRGGFGRTTSMMAIYDMIYNCKNVNFHDILNRMALMGGRNLVTEYDGLDGEIKAKDPGIMGTYKHYKAILRYNRLKHFYEYCRANMDNFQTSYSTFAAKTATRSQMN